MTISPFPLPRWGRGPSFCKGTNPPPYKMAFCITTKWHCSSNALQNGCAQPSPGLSKFCEDLVNIFFESPLPLGWWGWVEAFCSYISGDQWKWPPKGSTKSVFLQNPSKLYMPFLYKMTAPNPIFFAHFHHLSPRTPSTK